MMNDQAPAAGGGNEAGDDDAAEACTQGRAGVEDGGAASAF